MNIQTNSWVFQDTTTIGNGNVFKSGRNDQLTIYITNTANSFTVEFEGCDGETTPNWYPIPAVKFPELTTAISTNTSGVYVINLANWIGVRCRVSAISGGTVRITGRVVDVGVSLINATSPIPIQSALLRGTSTSNGTTSTLIDSTKNLELNSLNTKTIKFTVDNIEYIRAITSSVGDTIGFVDTQPSSPASVIVTGSTGGSMVINCKTAGASGNDYSVILVAGTGISQEGTVSFADNLLTITSPTDGSGNPTDIMPGNVEGIIDNDPALSALFDIGDYNAGFPLDILSEAVPFTGGSDGVIVVSGVDYVVF